MALLKFSKYFLSPYYIELVINSPLVKDQSRKNTQGIGNKNLVLKCIKNFTLPIPPLNEQHRIVAKVNQLMSLCDTLETKLTQSVTDSEELMEAAVRQILAANSNKTDIHESVFLESIHAEAAKLETKPAGRRNKKTQEQDAEAVQLNLPLFEIILSATLRAH